MDRHNNLIFLTNRVGRQLANRLLGELEFEGFRPQPTHVGLIADLVEQDGLRQQDLAISTIKDKATIARAVKQLETAGMLRREVDPTDRRQKIITLTARAHRLFALVRARADAALIEAQQHIDPDRMAVCIDVLHQVYQTLYSPGTSDSTQPLSPSVPSQPAKPLATCPTDVISPV